MHIAFMTSEAAPFAKTGGLADVSGALPKHLHDDLGQDIAVIMPLYRAVRTSGQPIEPTGIEFEVPVGQVTRQAVIQRSHLPGSDVPVYLIQQDAYFDRDSLYGDKGVDYKDNCERFVFFSLAAIETVKRVFKSIDVIHCNDWQTALVPVYMQTLYANDPMISRAASVMSIHNLAYQGLFWHWDMRLTGLDWSLFHWKQLEYYGKLNLLKGGIVFSDSISTVSKRYAQEIQTTEYAVGLESVIRTRAEDLYGIINGIDYTVWNPEVDKLIPAQYTAKDLSGKLLCKCELQKQHKLPERPEVPLIGAISRLDKQKGFDLLADIIDDLMQDDIQFVLLGTGEAKYHTLFEQVARDYPQKACINLAFSNALAHQIEAACDMFLMPSRYEPCGLNQMYSLKYGTVPIVRSTGGLADTIVDYNEKTRNDEAANGFAFEEYTPRALLETIRRAVHAYHGPDWHKLTVRGMKQDWSWARSAREYVEMYEKTMAKAAGKRQHAEVGAV
ncbi:MAG TPA: glycogen synthase GlgA [Planctomycetota bacterium]|nr:glycogen synthase GlgA [Planctomycetota bacterium]